MRKIGLILLIFVLQYNILCALNIDRTLPFDKSKDVSVSPTLSLRFNDYIANNTDSCFLNDILLLPEKITGKTVIFNPNFLQYNTSYKMVIPRGAFKSASTGELSTEFSFTFTTIQRPVPATATFDAIVSADGKGDFTTIRSAVLAAPTGRATPWLIFIKKGVYTELIRIPASKPNIHLIGEDPDSTILKFAINADNSTKYGYSNFAEAEDKSPVLVLDGNDFYAENLKIINSFGYDFQAGPQALAVGTYSDRSAFYNCSFYSFQDTWQTTNSDNTSYRSYAKKCYIEGAVDFIYNAGDCYFDSCTLALARNGTVITAPSHTKGSKWGYVFMNCDMVSSKPGIQRTGNYFGRPWHNTPKVRFINTTISKDITISEAGWIQRMGGLPDIFADYNTMDYLGNAVDLSKRNNYYYTLDNNGKISGECQSRQYCTDNEVAGLTVNNVLYGSDGWRPDLYMFKPKAPILKNISSKTICWHSDPQARCYAIFRNNNFLKFTTDTLFLIDDETSDYSVKSVNEWGSLGFPLEISSEIFSGTKVAKVIDKISIVDGQLIVKESADPVKIDVYSAEGRKYMSSEINGGGKISLPEMRFILIAIRQNESQRIFKYVR